MTKCARCKEEIEGKAYDRGAHSPIYYCEDCYEDTPKVKCVNPTGDITLSNTEGDPSGTRTSKLIRMSSP